MDYTYARELATNLGIPFTDDSDLPTTLRDWFFASHGITAVVAIPSPSDRARDGICLVSDAVPTTDTSVKSNSSFLGTSL